MGKKLVIEAAASDLLPLSGEMRLGTSTLIIVFFLNK